MPVHHASDQQPLGRGQGATGTGLERAGGPTLPRNTLSPFNRSFVSSLFWDGRVERLPDGSLSAPVPLPDGLRSPLEAQALMPLLNRDEMRGQVGDLDSLGNPNELAAIADDDADAVWSAVMARLMAIEEYRGLFAVAFPTVPEGDHGPVHLARALARFEMRLWELTDTPFDRFLGSEHRLADDEALSDDQTRGAELFFGDAGCFRCHSGPLLSDGAYHDIGVPASGPGVRDGIDEGRFLVTGDPVDRFAFRTPPLRNVAMTAPYMHNGTSATLEDAIRAHGTPPPDPEIAANIDPDAPPLKELSGDDIRQIVSFLGALSSRTEEEVSFGAGVPRQVPSGLEVDVGF
jgi:cytochrome c peroxidase